jgi:two-component system LytT family response regulator
MTKNLKVLIVDDERPARESLTMLLQDYCEGVEIVAQADSAAAAREVLRSQEVDALFIDIAMPKETGFDLLESIESHKYLFVFVTAFNQYALKALRASAVDYLQKPVDVDELKNATAKLLRRKQLMQQSASAASNYEQSLKGLITNAGSHKGVQRLCLPSIQGFSILDVNDILYLDADSNYTIFHLASLKKIVVSKSIKEFEDLLDPHAFFRVHKSSIIHLKYLKEFSRVDGYYAIMTDNTAIPVSRRRLPEFMTAVEGYNK